ncbi:aspartyl/asparaginyl beta-hydroxylase isoform X2 [Drosophila mauritiana]|uniref:Aspartyl/asparaginyl beta-hydroxylase isoform X2 n=1 Tax=Drosophila mauritiana TaxID=7226 RepID=A0A6P8JAC9_DROMA|nr:aspartyl/asparaginyl beta-hydroxylase isoform X2 [Drosophila mauritiana]
MSGDVQPRKRKDKRRKRDDRKSEGDVTVLRQSSFQDDDESSHGVHITKMGNDDLHLHVHHDHGTGGHWCAKIIFFALMAVLLSLVGLIIMENRGLEDLDTPLSESRFSKVFDGWVDEHRDEHDGHDVQEPSGEALDDHDEHDDHDDHEEEEEEPLSEELEEELEEEEQPTEEDEPATDDEDEEDEDEENNAGENITAEDAEEEDNDDDGTVEATVEATTEATTEATGEYEAEEDEDDEDEAAADDDVVESTEAPLSKAEEQEDDDEDEEEQEVEESVEPPRSQSAAQSAPATYTNDDDDDDDDQDKNDADDGDDDEFESLDQQFENDPEDTEPAKAVASEEQDQDQADEEEPKEEGSSWLASQIKPKEAAAVPAEKDDPFEQELRKANEEMIRENYAQALRSFNTLTTNFAHEPSAHLGRARLLELLAKKERSNQRLWEAIDAYKRYLAFGELIASNLEFKNAGESCIENLRFLGHHRQATTIHELLIKRLPEDPRLRNQLSLTYLMVNNLQQVEKVAVETLKLWPTNAVAQLHYGLALRQFHADYAKALPYLKYAVESEEEGTQEAFFYLSLGETMQRLSMKSEALEVYSKGVAKGFFASLYQRSLYNEPRLRAQPFWQPKETGYERQLEKLALNWRAIRDEGLALLGRSGFFEDEAELLRDKGVWQQYELYAQGRRVKDNCRRAPITCSLLEEFPESAGCRRGQVKFSVMQAKTHVWPHCGPTNCRLRAHLTLAAPEPEKTSLRVAEQERTWREGELFIFDDSFEHEVWHNGSQPRLVLILDMWHPQLSAAKRRSLTPI